jgi:iron only hydrogenase large subunit-like protein
VFEVLPERCVNCHACIAACPVKCNDGSGEFVNVRHEACIGCGACIDACSHGARQLVDDTAQFLRDVADGHRISAIVAPAVAATFPGQELRLNGWLKSLGVRAVFDVSFGAELTVKSYLAHVESERPKTVIAQPCPVLVSYAELYRPELLPYLAPADSPMVHTMKMVREYYPAHADDALVVVSPCIAKKREFLVTGFGDYNVTLASLERHFQAQNIDLRRYPETAFDNPPAERAVLFSSPGGLLETARRWDDDLGRVSRKIEGTHVVLDYFNHLGSAIADGIAPLLVDCLNCERGCNGGTGTLRRQASPDVLEHHVRERARAMQRLHAGDAPADAKAKVEALVEQHWRPNLYTRKYEDRSQLARLQEPSELELRRIYASMSKFEAADLYNCNSCGYGSCKAMALAIHNGRNQPSNCHHHTVHQLDTAKQSEAKRRVRDAELKNLGNATERIRETAQFLSRTVEALNQRMTGVNQRTRSALERTFHARQLTAESQSVVEKLDESSKSVGRVVDLIETTAGQLKFLSLNAMITSSRAGDTGRGFGVVAGEVRALAQSTARAAAEIIGQIEFSEAQTERAQQALVQIDRVAVELHGLQEQITGTVLEQTELTASVEARVKELASALDEVSSSLVRLANADEREDPEKSDRQGGSAERRRPAAGSAPARA